MEAKQVPAFLLPVFFVFLGFFSISERFAFSWAFCQIWSVIFCRSFPLPFLVRPSEKSQSCTWLTRNKEQKEACERFQACSRPSTEALAAHLPSTTAPHSQKDGWSAANHPWTCSCAAEGTTRCGHKVSLASSARQVECRRHCKITRTHDSRKQTHLYDVFAISFHSKDNSRYPGFIWCKTAIRWKCCTERYFFKQLPLCACEIPTFTLAMSPSILQLTPPHNKTAEYKIEFWPSRLLFFIFFFLKT